MTFITSYPRPWITPTSSQRPLPSLLDDGVVTASIPINGWSVQRFIGPDYSESPIILSDCDNGRSTYLIFVVGAGFCLRECRGASLIPVGDFNTLEEAAASLGREMMSQPE